MRLILNTYLMFCFRLQRNYTEMTNNVITKKKKVFVADFLNNRKKKPILESNLRIIGTTTK